MRTLLLELCLLGVFSLTACMQAPLDDDILAMLILNGDPYILSQLGQLPLSFEEYLLPDHRRMTLFECALVGGNIKALEILCKRGARLREKSFRILMKNPNWSSFYLALRWLVFNKVLDLKRFGAELVEMAHRFKNHSALFCLYRLGVDIEHIKPDWHYYAQMLSMDENSPEFFQFLETFVEIENESKKTPVEFFFLLATAHGAFQAVALILLHHGQRLSESVLRDGLNLSALNDHLTVFRAIMHHFELRNAAMAESLHELVRDSLGIAARHRSLSILGLSLTGYDTLRPSIGSITRLMLRDASHAHPIASRALFVLFFCLLLYGGFMASTSFAP